MSCPELGLPNGPIHELLSEIVSAAVPTLHILPHILTHPRCLLSASIRSLSVPEPFPLLPAHSSLEPSTLTASIFLPLGPLATPQSLRKQTGPEVQGSSMSTLSFSTCRLPLTLSQDGPSLPLQGLVHSPQVRWVSTGLGLFSAVPVWCSPATPLRGWRLAHRRVLGLPSKETHKCWLFLLYSC